MTPEQVRGTRFEIWLELLLKKLGYSGVKRNVHFVRDNTYRQADIKYSIKKGDNIYVILVEAKYASNGSVPYKLWTPKNKRGSNVLENIVEEVAERQEFCKADYTIIATNSEFDSRIVFECKEKGIGVAERPELEHYYKEAGGRFSLEKSIDSIDISLYSLEPRRIVLG